jgi:threonine dehydrogenase-like Zn-dependent dehydrogenase
MKAVLCKKLGPPEDLVVEDIPSLVPNAGQVVVAVKAAGVNFPDTLIIQGRYQFKPEPPFSPGGEVAGVVKELGANVTGVKVGDRVIAAATFGGFAEEMLCDADRLTPIPDSMDFVPASAFLLTYGTSYHALKDRAQLKAGETLLVLGASGGVGLAAVQLGKAMGARVIAAASSDAKLDVCRQNGADDVINYASDDLAFAGQGADGRQGRRRDLRPGRRSVLGTRAARHGVERPLPRRRLRGRRHPEGAAQSRAAEGLLDRRRVLGRVHAQRTREQPPQQRGADRAVRAGQGEAAHPRDVSAGPHGRGAERGALQARQRQDRAGHGMTGTEETTS